MAQSGRITTWAGAVRTRPRQLLAAAFGAERCDIYTDVDGVYTTDPRIVSKARKLEKIAFEEMLELASLGAKVLQTRSVELAMRYKVRLRVLSSFEDTDETSGTLVCDEEEMWNPKVVSGVAFSRDEAKMTLVRVEGSSRRRRRDLRAALGCGRQCRHDRSEHLGKDRGRCKALYRHDLLAAGQSGRARQEGLGRQPRLGGGDLCRADRRYETAKVSVVGIGMRNQVGVAAKMFAALAADNINIKVITTSEIKISVLIDRKYMELAVQTLHDTFELDKA